MEIVETSSNARSAELAAKEKSSAALGERSLQPKNTPEGAGAGHPGYSSVNVTRFIVQFRAALESPPTGDDRTSLMISVADKSRCLGQAIAKRSASSRST